MLGIAPALHRLAWHFVGFGRLWRATTPRSARMEKITLEGAEIYYAERFLPPDEAARFFDALLSKCAWERHQTSFGNAVPRDEAYYGDPATDYTYSRRAYRPLAWIPELLSLKARVEDATPAAA